MNFNNNKPIFVQIADLICRRVLEDIYLPEQRIPSVRELAVEMEVNPNTVMRTFEKLQQNNIIYNKRGVGYFISTGAKTEIYRQRHASFIEEDIPEFFNEMSLLGISFEKLSQAYSTYLSNQKKNNHEKE